MQTTRRLSRRMHLKGAAAAIGSAGLTVLHTAQVRAQAGVIEVAHDFGDGTAQNFLVYPDGRRVPTGCRYSLATGECVDRVVPRLSGTVHFLSTDARRGLELRGPQIKAFQQKHPEVTIDAFWPATVSGDVLATLLAANEPLDVFSTGDVNIPVMAARNWARDLNPLIERDATDVVLEDYFPALVELAQWDGKMMGLAEGWSTPLLYYNRNLFDRNGLKHPDANWTYDQLLDAAKRIARPNDEPPTWGAAQNASFFVTWLGTVWAFGGDLFSADRRRCLLNTPESVSGLQWIADLMHRHKVMPPPEYTSVPGQSMFQLFPQGRLGIFLHEAQFRTSELLDFFAVPIPKGTAGRHNFIFTSYHALGAASARNPETGWEWIKFMLSPEGYAARGGVQLGQPSRRSIHEGPLYVVPPWLGERGITAANRISAETLRPTPIIVYWQDAMQAIGQALTPVWNGEKDAKRAMEEVVPVVNNILARL